MKLETLAVHAARHPDPATGAVAQPITLTSTFARSPDGELISDHSYTRSGNPNRSALEKALAQLEDGARAVTFASGVAAIHAVLQCLSPGDHVIAPSDVYHGTRALISRMADWGLEISFVDLWEMDKLDNAIRPNTRLVFLETPSNPLLQVTDIAAAAEKTHAAGAKLVVDNTWPTPVLTRPFEFGADIVVHSSTKYFGGHSDVLGGALVFSEPDAFAEKAAWLQANGGAVPAPFDCWLIRRGLMTLPLRVRAQSAAAAEVAAFLAQHPAVEQVLYPGLPAHPGHEIAKRQMSMYGAMLSIRVKGGEENAARVLSGLQLFARATSLGAVESLVEHRYKVEGENSTTPQDLLRISIGLEHPDDLIADLEQALE